MLSKSEFFAKHAAKYAGLPAAEKERRWKQYLASNPSRNAGASRTIARRRSTPSQPSPTSGLLTALAGCGTDYPALDDTPVLRGANHQTFVVNTDASGNVGFCLFPGALFSNTSTYHYAPTFTGPAVTAWNAGTIVAPPVSLLKARIIGCSIRIFSTAAPLNLSGNWAACIFMPDDSSGYWPTATTNIMVRPQCMSGRADKECRVLIPPARLDILRLFNDTGVAADKEKLTGHPSFCFIGNSYPATSGLVFDICWSWEMTTSAGAGGDGVLMHQYPPPGPGFLDRVSTTISHIGTQAFSYLASDPAYLVKTAAAGYNAYTSAGLSRRAHYRSIT